MSPDLDTAFKLSDFLSSGTIEAVFFILVLIIGGLIYERIRLLRGKTAAEKQFIEAKDREIEAKEKELQSIKEIIEKYHEGNLSLGNTLVEIKVVLQTLQSTLGNRSNNN